ncbi:MAG: hypothetical protein ACP5RP_02650 [Candidatus Micrarchaeia archaeon]
MLNYTSYMTYNGNFANFEYFYANGTIIPAWIESNASNTLTIWAKVSNTIFPNTGSATATNTIYLGFANKTTNLLSSSGTTGIGEAPQLSSTYAQYDDGASVFNFYDNFKGTTLNTTKWVAAVNGGSITVNNGVTLNSGTSNTADYAGLEYANSQNPSNIIIETLMNIYGSNTTGSSRNRDFRTGEGTVISMGWGDAGMFGNSGTPQYYDGAYSGVSVPIGTSSTNYNLFEQWQFPSSGTLTWTSFNNNGGSAGTKIFSASTTFTVAPFTAFYTTTFDQGSLSIDNIQWTRIRAYPPNGVMPSVRISGTAITITPSTSTYPNNAITISASCLPLSATCELEFPVGKVVANNLNISINLTNSQNIATPAPFQQMINLSESSLPITYNSNFADFEYTYANGTIIPAWIESNQSGKLITWVKIAKGIPASSSIIIYLKTEPGVNLLSSSGTTGIGEAPQLSSTYAQYDDGANVFLSYFNGDTGISNFTVATGFTLSKTSTTMLNGNTGNVINVSGGGSSVQQIPFAYNKGYILQPSIAEASARLYGSTGTAQGIVAILNSPSTTVSTSNGIGVTMGLNSAYFSQFYDNSGSVGSANTQGTATTSWVYGSVTFTGINSTGWTGYIAPQLYSTVGGYYGTNSIQPIKIGTYLYLSNLGSADSSYPYAEYINWERARTYPPNGVMPSVTIHNPTTYTISNMLAAGVYTASANVVGYTGNTTSTFTIDKATPIPAMPNFPLSFTYNGFAPTITASLPSVSNQIIGNLYLSFNNGANTLVASTNAIANTITYATNGTAGTYAFTFNTVGNGNYIAATTSNSFVILPQHNANASGGTSHEYLEISDNINTSIKSNVPVITLYTIRQINATSISVVPTNSYNQDQLPVNISIGNNYYNFTAICGFSSANYTYSFAGTIYGISAIAQCNKNYTVHAGSFEVFYNKKSITITNTTTTTSTTVTTSTTTIINSKYLNWTGIGFGSGLDSCPFSYGIGSCSRNHNLTLFNEYPYYFCNLFNSSYTIPKSNTVYSIELYNSTYASILLNYTPIYYSSQLSPVPINYIAFGSNNNSTLQSIYWLRLRAYPPEGVMPQVYIINNTV